MSRFGFEVSTSFEDLSPTSQYPYSSVRNDERGVLMSCRMSPSEIPDQPSLVMRFLRTRLEMGHDNMLDEYPNRRYDATHHPIMQLPFGDSVFRIAARYTLYNYPIAGNLSVGLMISSPNKGQEVQNLPGYKEARHTLAVACAQAVLETLADGQERKVALNATNNFDNFDLRASKGFSGIGNLEQFNEYFTP